MSSLLSEIPALSLSNVFHLIGIVVAALLINRLLRLITKRIVKPAASQTRAAQAREQQTRALAGVVYSGGSAVVWALALLMAAQEFGVNVTPVVAVAGLASLAIGFGAQNLVRDVISGFYIILEDQYSVGDTIQVTDTIGRVEHLTLRRTVVRDAPRRAGNAGKWRDSHGGQLESRLVAGFCGRGVFAGGRTGKGAAGAGYGSDGTAQRSVMVAGAGGWPTYSWDCSRTIRAVRRYGCKFAPRQRARMMCRGNCGAGYNWSFSGRAFPCRVCNEWSWFQLAGRIRRKHRHRAPENRRRGRHGTG